MIRPHPPRLRMNRRNTVSVTPAIGASTVAGRISTPPSDTDAGTWPPTSAPPSLTGFSQNFRTVIFYSPQRTQRHRGNKNRHRSTRIFADKGQNFVEPSSFLDPCRFLDPAVY